MTKQNYKLGKDTIRRVFKPALLLAMFALLGVLLLDMTNEYTRERIVENERNALMRQLMEVIDPASHDNDLINDRIELPGEWFHSRQPVTVYRARLQGKPGAALFVTSTDKGYQGTIRMVVGVRTDKSISGVRVVQHNETPGLGDKIELQKSPWVLRFNNTSLQQPELSKWYVKKDGGYFDQFTGATITPRAVVGAVRDVLIWSSEDNNLQSVFTYPKNTKIANNPPHQ